MKKFFIGLLILILIPILAVTIFILTFDLNNYKNLAQKKLSEALNESVTIGAMSTKLALIPTIQISDFKISNSKNHVILLVPKMEATIELAPLLKKQVNIQKIYVTSVDMDMSELEQKKATETTPQKSPEALKAQKAELSKLLWVEDVHVDKLSLRFKNGQAKENLVINNFAIKNMSNFNMKLNYLNNAFDIEGTFGTLTALLSNPDFLPIDLKIKQRSMNASLRGQIGQLSNMSKIRLDFDAKIAKLSELSSLLKADLKNMNYDASLRFSAEGDLNKLTLKKFNLSFGQNTLNLTGTPILTNLSSKPEIIAGLNTVLESGMLSKKLGLNPFELTTSLKASQNEIKLDKITYLANKSDLNGNILVNLVKAPIEIQANLNGSYLDLKDVLYQEENKQIQSEPAKNERKKFIPKYTLPWDILGKFNLNGQIQISKFPLAQNITDYASINIKPTLSQGVLTSPIQMRTLSGTINSIARLNQKDKSIQFKLEGKNLSLNKISPINKEIKDSYLNNNIDIQTKGNTLAEAIANSEGKVTIELTGGKIINKWFNTLADNLEGSKMKTAFATTEKETKLLCAVLNSRLQKGILSSNDQVVLQTEIINLIINGRVNLNNETLNLSVIPTLVKTSDNLTSLMQVIQLSGPWTNPLPTVNTQKVVSSLINQLINKNTKQPTQTKPTALCEKALGHSLSKVEQPVQTQTKVVQQEKPKKEKTDLKQQLFNSLSAVLKNKGQ